MLGIFLSIAFFRAEVLGNGEVRHNGRMVDAVKFHLVADVHRIRQGFGYIGEDFVHLRLGLHPFLFGIEHTGRVVQILSSTQTNQSVMRLGILFVHEMHVVGTHQLHAELFGVFYQLGIGYLLKFKSLTVRLHIRVLYLVALQLQIEIIAKHPFIPLDSFLRLIQFSLNNLFGDLSRYTRRADNQSFVILL